MKRVGIDIGSTTVKIAVLDDNNNILFSMSVTTQISRKPYVQLWNVLTTNLVTATSHR